MNRTMITTLAWDIGLALGGYYGLRLLGLDDYLALLISAGAVSLRLGWTAIRHRRFDPFGAFLIVVLGIGLVLSLLTGDARFLLLKESFGTGVAGLIILLSCLAKRPLVLSAVRQMSSEAKRKEIDRLCRRSSAFERSFTMLSLVWGAGLLVEALLRIPLVYQLDPDVMAGLSQVLLASAIVLLAGWTSWYAKRFRALSV